MMGVYKKISCPNCRKEYEIRDERKKIKRCKCSYSINTDLKKPIYFIDYYVQGRRKREKIGSSKTLAENVLRKRKLQIAENRYLEKEEIKKLLDSCSDHLKPIVILALNTGMRKGEILGLKWHDIDFQRGIIYLLDTKNGEKREILMNEIAKRTLIGVRKHPDSPYVFCKKDGRPYGDIKKSFFTAIRKAGIIDFRFHDLRHTFASHLVMSGVDLNTVRELMGHKSLDMTLRYSHLSPDHKRRAIEVLGHQMDTIWTLGIKRARIGEGFTLSNRLQNKQLEKVMPV